MLSYKYHCRSADNPGGVMTKGRSVAEGDQSRLSILNFTSLLSLYSFMVTCPGQSEVIVKWCCFLIWGILRKCGARYPTQSKEVTIGVPSSVPVSCVVFDIADCSIVLAMSAKQPTLVLRSLCFASPKHQSGANLVCPATRNDRVMLLWRPDSTLQQRYCKGKNIHVGTCVNVHTHTYTYVHTKHN